MHQYYIPLIETLCPLEKTKDLLQCVLKFGRASSLQPLPIALLFQSFQGSVRTLH